MLRMQQTYGGAVCSFGGWKCLTSSSGISAVPQGASLPLAAAQYAIPQFANQRQRPETHWPTSAPNPSCISTSPANNEIAEALLHRQKAVDSGIVIHRRVDSCRIGKSQTERYHPIYKVLQKRRAIHSRTVRAASKGAHHAIHQCRRSCPGTTRGGRRAGCTGGGGGIELKWRGGRAVLPFFPLKHSAAFMCTLSCTQDIDTQAVLSP